MQLQEPRKTLSPKHWGCVPIVDAVLMADLRRLVLATGYKINTKHPAVFLHTNNE